jgi:hypothetical protein
MHIRNVPSYFCANRRGAAKGEVLGLIRPCFRRAVSWRSTSANSAGLNLYIPRTGGRDPGFSWMGCGTFLVGGHVHVFDFFMSRIGHVKIIKLG